MNNKNYLFLVMDEDGEIFEVFDVKHKTHKHQVPLGGGTEYMEREFLVPMFLIYNHLGWTYVRSDGLKPWSE